MQKIIDTFLFSQPHEKNILLCKLHAEYECVNEFIGIESAYDFRGNYKGLWLNEVLEDPAFDKFKDKITVLSSETSLFPNNYPKEEKNYFLTEFASRGYCWDYVQKKYNDNDWLIVSDCDEMLDFSNPKRRDILLNDFKKYNESIQHINYKFWWDFDNLNLDPDKYIPCHKIGALKERENPFWHRNNHCKRLEPDLVCGIEYAYCFSLAGNWSKVNTFAHDRYRPETMDLAYKCNTWHREAARNEYISSPLHFFETIEIDETNSTRYVLENIDKLKVNTIDKDYASNRIQMYGLQYPHPVEQRGLLRGNKINRNYHYFRRSK